MDFIVSISKENILNSLSIKDVIDHFGINNLVKEMDSSEIIEAIGYKESLRIIDIDYAIEFVEECGFLVEENYK